MKYTILPANLPSDNQKLLFDGFLFPLAEFFLVYEAISYNK